jgi:hypothetical protein
MEDISSDLRSQLRNKTKEFESFCLALDESNVTNETSQLLIIIRGITESFDVIED